MLHFFVIRLGKDGKFSCFTPNETKRTPPLRIYFRLEQNRRISVVFRSIGESESENMHLARLWREGSPERQLVALSA